MIISGKDRRYLPELDGLRGVAVVSVLVGHIHIHCQAKSYFPFRFLSGDLGVDIFFVLSGFLITSVLINDKAENRDLKGFWIRRAGRLLPAYLVFIIGTHFIWGVGQELPWAVTYTYNYARDFGIFDGQRIPLGHIWSLCVEEHFYFLWPLIFWYCPRRSVRIVCVGAMLISWLSALQSCSTFVITNMPTHHRLGGLAFGCLVATSWEFVTAERVAVLGFIFLCASKLMGFSPYWAGESGHAMQMISRCLLANSVFCLVVFCCLGRYGGRTLGSVLRNRFLIWLGMISYGLYLYHLPVYWLFGVSGVHLKESAVSPYLAIVVTFCLAMISHRWIETPVRVWSRSWNSTRIRNTARLEIRVNHEN